MPKPKMTAARVVSVPLYKFVVVELVPLRDGKEFG